MSSREFTNSAEAPWVRRAADFCRRHSTLILGSSVFLGVLFPALARLMSPLLMPSVFVLTVFAFLSIHPDALIRSMTRIGLLGAVSIWQLGIFPLVVAATLWALPVPGSLWTPLLVTACASPIFSSPAFARIVGLDAALTTAVVVTATFLMPLSLFLYSELFLASGIRMDLTEYAWRVGMFLFLPLLLAWILRRETGDSRFRRLETRLDLLTLAALVVFAVAVMDGVAARLSAQPGQVLAYLAAAFAVNLYAQLTAWAAFSVAGRETAWTVALTSGFRNMALVLGITGNMLGSDFLLFVGVAQVPMYVLPMIMKPIYARLGKP